jgi:23S rRNA (cytidine1920-2'-O)/16S rRNA (cytidine1409-2'-O)-methyltransferase
VDVGHGQIDWRLRNDPRVVVLDRTNVRYISPNTLGEQVDLAVIDVSFISLTKVIPPVISCVKPGGTFLALIKPQFEVGKGQVGKGGVVRDPRKHLEVIEKIKVFVASLGCEVKGVAQSRLLGPKGNKEFFILFVGKE